MKPKTMILMVVAVACGLGASYMTSRLLAERPVPEEEKKVTVLVAKKFIETGAIVRNPKDMFEEKVFIAGTENKNALTNFDELKSKVLKRSLREGDAVTANDLLGDRETYIAYMLPKDHVAVGLRTNIEQIAGGFSSLPLSRVDIISTVKRGDDKSSFSQLLLQNVLVLAADQTVDRPEKGALVATTVTLALTPEDAQKINLAKEYGPLSLALRKFNDTTIRATNKMTFEDIYNQGKSKDVTEGPAEPPKVLVKEPELPKTKTILVNVTNGDQQKLVEFTLDENNQVLYSRELPRDGFTPRAENIGAPAAPNPGTPAPKGAEPKVGSNS